MNVIFEDESLLVLDKPSGITVNRSDTTVGENTVQDFVEEKVNLTDSDPDSDFYKRSGIVHRIDKETSGILLVAKDLLSFESLQKQFKDRSIEKKYTLLVHGKVIPTEGKITFPVGRLPWNRKRFGVLAGGREAETFYKVTNYKKFDPEGEILSLVEARPKTGRTHQIRVHFKAIGHPIYADEIYAGRKTARDDRKKLSRLFLHASEIQINHPKTGEKVIYKSELSEDLRNFLDKLVNFI